MNKKNLLKWGYGKKTSVFRSISRIILGLLLVFTGTGHLTWSRIEFLAQVPSWVPLNPDLTVVLSGLAEITLGLALIFLWKWKALAGWATAMFFILIFPGNISQYVNGVDAFGLNTDKARFIRLFFQPVLVFWAIWATGAWQTLKSRNK